MASDPSTRIQLCGHLVVTVEGRRVEDRLPGRQGRLLLAYLVLARDRRVGRDELLDALWPRALPAAPGVALSALVSKLRAVLGADAIAGRLPDEIRLRLPGDAWVDLEAARGAVHQAESAAAGGDWDRSWVQGHVGMYISGRTFLAGHEGAWVDGLRRELEDVHLRSIECVGAAQLAIGGGELATAERLAARLTEIAPFRESGYRLLMEVLAARGNAAEALLVYDRLRCLLRDELGAAPCAAVQAVHERLLRQTAAPS